MCRIFGYVGRRMGRSDLQRSARLLHHGGPDGRYYVAGDGWGIGATRLAVTDPAGGAQPYRLNGREGDLIAVFNGEIYNHQELCKELQSVGYRFRDNCDGSIIPALYELYGDDFVHKLDGMYAIALIDLRGAPTVVIATDDSGMKPVYYARVRPDEFVFCSELATLLEFPRISRRLWLPGVDAYFTTRTPLGERTMFDDVRVLPPATTGVFARGALQIRHRTVQTAATDAPNGGDRGGKPDRSLGQAGAELAELLRYETRRLAQADAPVAAICSGGLDSSLITALLSEQLPGLAAFHIGYLGRWPMAEAEYAAQVATQSRVLLHQISLDPAEIPMLLPRVIRHLGQPNADPIAVSTYALFRAVHEAGFKVALTGDAADEHFGGYDRVRSALSRAAAGTDEGWVPGYVESLSAVPKGLRLELYSEDYRDLLHQTVTAEEALTDALHTMPGCPLDKITKLEVASRLPAYHLRRVDHLSMSSAVEARLVFCQPSVTRFAAALPGTLRVTPGAGKRALYAAASGLLPESVASRPKQPFTLPISAMLTPGGPLHAFARDVLVADEVRRTGLLRPEAVDALFTRFTRSSAQPNDRLALAIWSLVVFHIWYREIASSAHHLGPMNYAEPSVPPLPVSEVS